jgi:hypothetical protein
VFALRSLAARAKKPSLTGDLHARRRNTGAVHAGSRIGSLVGTRRSGDSNDAMSGSLDCAVQRTFDLQPRHRLDVLVDRSEL